MSKDTMKQEEKPTIKLTRAEKKEINKIIAKYKSDDENLKSAQESVPYRRIYYDGICQVDESFYSKTVLFEDINYQLAENEDKSAIFDGWSNFLNSFDPSVEFQLSFLNITGNEKTFEDSVTIVTKNDDFNAIREEYSRMLLKQLSK
ncbi:MAG: VirB4-like conjugal transfer ATPase, CD1110 family, partial [Anaerotignaceae bacterium]